MTLILLSLGVVMVFSASWASAYFGENQDGYFYLKRELLYGGLGLILMFGLARYDFMRLRKVAPLLMVTSLGLLFFVLLFGASAKGATRWIGAGPVTFQPSELAKLALVIYVAEMMYKRPWLLRDLRSMALPILGLPALACLLVLAQPDMGTAVAIIFTVAAMLLVGGVRVRDMALLGAGAGVLGTFYVALEPYRLERITAFLHPVENARDSGYQIIQSLVALGSGGVLGVGIGKSIQKFNYLPEAHTDMILSIIGEEVGLIGVLGVVILFGAFAFLGYRVALKSDNLFGKYVAAGITSLLVSQAAINLGAVTGLLPLTGIPLPLISYGGSSLVVILSGIGILLNIAVNPRGKIAAPPQRKLRAIEGGNGRGRNSRPSGSGSGYRRRAQG